MSNWDKISRRIGSRRITDKNPITSDKSVTVKESIYQIECWLKSLAGDSYYMNDLFKQICNITATQEHRIESKLQAKIDAIDKKLDRLLDC